MCVCVCVCVCVLLVGSCIQGPVPGYWGHSKGQHVHIGPVFHSELWYSGGLLWGSDNHVVRNARHEWGCVSCYDSSNSSCWCSQCNLIPALINSFYFYVLTTRSTQFYFEKNSFKLAAEPAAQKMFCASANGNWYLFACERRGMWVGAGHDQNDN